MNVLFRPGAAIAALLLVTSCQRECRVVKLRYANEQERVVFLYPDCRDTAYYQQQHFYPNGQVEYTGFYRHGQRTGHFQSWAANGQQTADWHILDGKEHGYIQCWYENGRRKKQGTLNRGIQNGWQKTWYENGQPESAGRFVQGKQEGRWTYWDEDGGWKVMHYRQDVLSGPTLEHLVDSAGVTLVSGQYQNGQETGLWRWFDQDSTLYESAEYANGRAQGAYLEYYPDGRVKARGTLQNGELTGVVQYFSRTGQPTSTAPYRHGRRIR